MASNPKFWDGHSYAEQIGNLFQKVLEKGVGEWGNGGKVNRPLVLPSAMAMREQQKLTLLIGGTRQCIK